MTDSILAQSPVDFNHSNVLTGADTLRRLAADGAGFTLCCGKAHNCASPGKRPHEKDWQLHPHTLAEAEAQLKRGGNAGILGSPELCCLDVDFMFSEFCELFGLADQPMIVRGEAPYDRGKLLYKVQGETPKKAGKWRYHDRAKHPCLEWLYGANAVVAGTHESGETIKLINAGAPIPEVTERDIYDMADIWLVTLGAEHMIGRVEPVMIPAPAPDYTPKPETPKLPEAAKESGVEVHTVKDLLEDVLRAWTPLEVFERFGRAAHGTQEDKGGWVRVLGNGGLFIHGEGREQFWALTGAVGNPNVPGGGPVQAWVWCESGGLEYNAKGKRFVDVLKAMGEAKGTILLPAEVVKKDAQPKPDKRKNGKVDFAELLGNGAAAQDETLKPGSWADLAVQELVWDWKLWAARGFLTLLSSESGLGKSNLMLRLAGCYLCGWPLPDGTPFAGERGAVLWVEAEAAQGLNRERASKWGLPVDQILTPIAPDADFSLTDRAHVEALAAAAAWPNVKAIFIDSISGAYPAVEKSTEDAIPVMKWLAKLARDNNKVVCASHHLRKRGIFDGDTVDLDRLRGASAIAQPARLVWAMDTPDPNDKACKRLSVIKSNLAKFPEPVGLTIDDAGVKFGAAPEAPKTETVADKAMDLLRALLEDAPKPAKVIEGEFHQAGISLATMKRAKQKLGVISVKDKDGWKWGLPEGKGYPYDN